MRFRMLVLAALILGIQPDDSFAEKVWTSFTASDAVYDIAIQGDYVWCATANGPVRWDRRDMSFKVFNTIPDNRVNCLAVDAKGDVWFGTGNGVYCWDHATGLFADMSAGLKYKRIFALAVSADGTMWISTGNVGSMMSGHIIYRLVNNRWVKIEEDNTIVNKLVIDLNGRIWWTHHNTLFFYDGSIVQKITQADGLPNESIQNVLIDKKGEIWAAANSKMFHFTGGKWETQSFGKDTITAVCAGPDSSIIIGIAHDDSLNARGIAIWNGMTWNEIILGQGKEKTVSALISSPDGMIFIGANDGLYSYSSSGWKHFPSPEHLPIINIPNIVKCIIDPSGVFWIANIENILRFDGVESKFIPIPKTYPQLIINDMKVSDNGWIWLGTNNGVFRYDGKGWILYGERDGLKDISYSGGIVFITIDPAGKAWALTQMKPFWFDGKKWNQYPNTILDSMSEIVKRINSMTFAPDGKIWFGVTKNYNSFAFISEETEILLQMNKIYEVISCLSMAFDIEGNLWAILRMGYYGGGPYFSVLVKYKGTDRTLFQNISTFYANTMVFGPDNSIWVSSRNYHDFQGGVSGGGLAHYSDGIYTRYTTDNGLIDNAVVSVACSPDGTVWAATPSGFSRYGEPLDPIITSISDAAPTPLPLLRNYPNPFNPSTTITFSLPAPGKVSLTVYDITGRKVCTLVSGRLSAGTHSAVWDGLDDSGRAVSSGVYLSRLTTGKHTAVGKMLLMK